MAVQSVRVGMVVLVEELGAFGAIVHPGCVVVPGCVGCQACGSVTGSSELAFVSWEDSHG
jgi:hypothetical protein